MPPHACHEFDPVVVLRIGPDITWDSCTHQRIETVLNHGDRGMVICDVAAIQCPTLDVLARLQLSVRRRGRHPTVRGAQSELPALLALAGLIEVLGVTSNSPRGSRGRWLKTVL
ncbi:MAG TPA: hypothetical protein VFN75_05520 [Pseudonocardiaceae bacterium]|nr:hypothetical protein [Pseudonocardiaceae bacterium]